MGSFNSMDITSDSQLNIRALDNAQATAWDAYCDTHRASYACYSLWQQLLPNMGWTPLFLAAYDTNNNLCGILPSAISNRTLNKTLVSTWGDGRMYAGIYADNQSVASALLENLEKKGSETRIQRTRLLLQPDYSGSNHVEELLCDSGYQLRQPDPQRMHYTFIRDLSGGYEKLLSDIGSRNRSKTRKSEREGLQIREGSEHITVDMYYNLKKEVWKRLGNLCPRRQELETIYNQVPDNRIQWWSAWFQDQFVGALYCYITNHTCTLKGTIFDIRFGHLNINLALYLASLRYACESRCSHYDFGSTPPPGSGHYRWKSMFKGYPIPIRDYIKTSRPMPQRTRSAIIRATRSPIQTLSYHLHLPEHFLQWYEE